MVRPRARNEALERAESDVRATYASLSALIDQVSRAGKWETVGEDGWSWAEILLHAAEVGDEVVERLRLALHRGVKPEESRGTMKQRLRREFVLRSWHWAGASAFHSMGGSGGLLLSPEAVQKRHLKHAANFIEALRSAPAPVLESVFVRHDELGGMTGLQWARLLRIHSRSLELRR